MKRNSNLDIALATDIQDESPCMPIYLPRDIDLASLEGREQITRTMTVAPRSTDDEGVVIDTIAGSHFLCPMREYKREIWGSEGHPTTMQFVNIDENQNWHKM